MKKTDIACCEELIKQWKETTDPERKNQIRNQIFSIIRPSMNQWVQSALSKRGMETTSCDTQSQAWDCFVYALNHYKDNGGFPIPNHFYGYTRFYLCKKDRNKEDATGRIEDFEDFGGTDELTIVYGHIEELKQFRSTLPPEYAIVFDDSIMGFLPYNHDRTPSIEQSGLSYTKYYEAKKILKCVVQYLLTR
jgi:hypothetical protein